MLNILKYSTLVLFVIVMAGCTKGFEELNISPNEPTNVPPSYLLSQAQHNLVNLVLGQNGFAPRGIHYVQWWSQNQYTRITRYDTDESDFSNFYTGGLADLQEVIRLNTDADTKVVAQGYGSNENQRAVAHIMRAWIFQTITDIWGSVPYSEALQKEKISCRHMILKKIFI